MIALAVVGCWSVWQWHVWFSWLVMSLVQIPVAAACSVVFATERAVQSARWGETREFAPSSSTAAPGQPPSVPDHELVRCIGRGSYGEVWLGRNVMGTWRAVKMVHRESNQQRFEREFAGLKKFEPISRAHEGLVDILHVGRDDGAGYFYYVMELADDAAFDREKGRKGERERDSKTAASPRFSLSPPPAFDIASYTPRTLRPETRGPSPLPLNDCLQIGLALTGALDFLHQQGLIHRDIKPSNIIFVAGLPKLADIGLVADVGEARSFVGTEGYIPPEGPGTPQADVFSLGKVLYGAVTGLDIRQFPQLPNEARHEGDQALKFYRAIAKACEPDARKRYTSAREMHADLLRLA
jgi:serine/threonine protein kinase